MDWGNLHAIIYCSNAIGHNGQLVIGQLANGQSNVIWISLGSACGREVTRKVRSEWAPLL